MAERADARYLGTTYVKVPTHTHEEWTLELANERSPVWMASANRARCLPVDLGFPREPQRAKAEGGPSARNAQSESGDDLSLSDRVCPARFQSLTDEAPRTRCLRA